MLMLLFDGLAAGVGVGVGVGVAAGVCGACVTVTGGKVTYVWLSELANGVSVTLSGHVVVPSKVYVNVFTPADHWHSSELPWGPPLGTVVLPGPHDKLASFGIWLNP